MGRRGKTYEDVRWYEGWMNFNQNADAVVTWLPP